MWKAYSLCGRFVRLEPLDRDHFDGLVAAAAVDPSLYQWSLVPQGKAEAARYIDAALAGRDAGTALPFATVRIADDAVIGSTRFFDIEHWAWPLDHPRHGRTDPDACEIGYSWLTRSAIRTAANTEAKLLMLTMLLRVGRCSASACTPMCATSVRGPQWSASARSLRGYCEDIGWLRISRRAIRLATRSYPRTGRT